MKSFTLLVMLAACLCTVSCSSDRVIPAEDLAEFVEAPENNLTRKTLSHNYQIAITYIPAELLVFEDINGKPSDHKRIAHLEQKYSNQYHFKVTLSKKMNSDTSDIITDQQVVKKLPGSISEFVHLSSAGEEVIPVGDFFLYRSKKNDNAVDIMVTFNKDKFEGRESIKIIIREFGLGTGNQEFMFYINDMENIPKVKFPIVS